ncbi:MAG: hypothetical protein ACFN22_06795, partial [Porphyromonas pasteri]
IGIKLLMLLLGALGVVNMWAAVFADVGVTILAILNALRSIRVSNVHAWSLPSPTAGGRRA